MSSPNRALHARRVFAKYSRWLHIYGSMISFGVVFFFAVTGLTLNHPQWFSAAQRTATLTGTLDTRWTGGATEASVDKLAIVEYLRSAHGLHGAVGDFRIDDRECGVGFRGPGYSADVFVDRATGRYDITEMRQGLAAVANDLHKGRDSGDGWRLLIDLSAGLLVFVSGSGLCLLWFIHRHRMAGALSLVAGVVLTYLAYATLVP